MRTLARLRWAGSDEHFFGVRWGESKRGGLFVPDADLGEVVTPNGRVCFLEVRVLPDEVVDRLRRIENDALSYDQLAQDIIRELPAANAVPIK